MEGFTTKYGLIFRAFGITVTLLVVRLVFDYLNFDILAVTNLITAFMRRSDQHSCMLELTLCVKDF